MRGGKVVPLRERFDKKVEERRAAPPKTEDAPLAGDTWAGL